MKYSEIVPSVLQDELIQIRDSMTDNSWRVGDICVELERYGEAMKYSISAMDIYKAVAMFAGKRSRTVREYAGLSAFYSPGELRSLQDGGQDWRMEAGFGVVRYAGRDTWQACERGCNGSQVYE
jgi:hypothetical protein